jgi:2',3'-cyclic-nucleotide 2'-phosphodiesterase (5'-nucleotidase family)
MAWNVQDGRPLGKVQAATVVDSLRTQYPGAVVLVDAGDLLQGTRSPRISRPSGRAW